MRISMAAMLMLAPLCCRGEEKKAVSKTSSTESRATTAEARATNDESKAPMEDTPVTAEIGTSIKIGE